MHGSGAPDFPSPFIRHPAASHAFPFGVTEVIKQTLLASLGAAAALAVAVPAIAQMGGDRPAPGADITRAQAEQMATGMFARMDANSDGKIDQADRAARQQAKFQRMDSDSNGSLSLAEFTARPQRAERPDRAERAQRPAGERQAGERRQGRRGPGGRHGGGMMGMSRMADTNNDGTITQAEFTAGALAMFDRADANHDGTVTGEERRAARPERPQRGAARPAAAS